MHLYRGAHSAHADPQAKIMDLTFKGKDGKDREKLGKGEEKEGGM